MLFLFTACTNSTNIKVTIKEQQKVFNMEGYVNMFLAVIDISADVLFEEKLERILLFETKMQCEVHILKNLLYEYILDVYGIFQYFTLSSFKIEEISLILSKY